MNFVVRIKVLHCVIVIKTVNTFGLYNAELGIPKNDSYYLLKKQYIRARYRNV